MSSVARRVGIYVRISRDKAGAGLGVERQTADCRALADRLGWPIVGAPYTDNDISAYSGKRRPGYRSLLADIEAGRVDTVITWHTDRLHRSPTELEEWITICEPRGVGVHTVKAGPIELATPSGRMIARQLGAVARYESEHRSERVTAAMDKIARDGRFLGGVRPFGYTRTGMKRKPAEARLIKEATRAILGGQSLRSVARAWNEAGAVTTKEGRPWTPNKVREVLSRPRNAGLLEHRGKVIGPAGWPKIVDEDEWRGLCAVLNDPARRSSPGRQPRWLGSMLYRCSVCGAGLYVGAAGKVRRSAYRCSAKITGGDGVRHVTRAAEPLDEFVSRLIVARLSLPDAATIFTRSDSEIDTPALRVELAAIDAQRTELGTRLGTGEITMAMFDAANTSLRARQAALEGALATSTVRSPAADIAASPDVARAWEEIGLDARRTILADLATITVLPAPTGQPRGGSHLNPECIKIEWRDHGA